MSITIMSQVWKETETSGSERLVLLALADIANDEGTCWPSMQTVANKCNLSRRYVIDMIANLEKRNYIRRQRRLGETGKLTSNIYKILTPNLLVSPASPLTSEPCLTNLVRPASLTSEPCLTNLVRPASQNPSLKPSNESSIDPTIPNVDDKKLIDTQGAARIFRTVTKLATFPSGSMDKDIDAICSMVFEYGEEETIRRMKAAFSGWSNKRGKNGRPYSKTNTAWIDYALANEVPKSDSAPELTSPARINPDGSFIL